MHQLLILALFLLTGCYYEQENFDKAKAAYHELCPESQTVAFEKLTSNSTCKGMNIIVAAFIHDNIFQSENKVKYLKELFRDERGFHDWDKQAQFVEPSTGRNLAHLIAEYGNDDEISSMFWDYDIFKQIMKTDLQGENIYHKMVRNKRYHVILFSKSEANLYVPGITDITPTSPRINFMVYQPNAYGMTPMDLAAELGKFEAIFFLYENNPVKQEMAKYFIKYGKDLAFESRVSLYPELNDYFLPYLFSKKLMAQPYSNNHQRYMLSLFELNYGSPGFTQYLINNESYFDNFMSDTQMINQLLMNMPKEWYWIPDGFAQTVLFYFAYSDFKDMEFFKEVLRNTSLTQENFRGETIFHVLAKNGKENYLKAVLRELDDKKVLLKRNHLGQTAREVCSGKGACALLEKATRSL